MDVAGDTGPEELAGVAAGVATPTAEEEEEEEKLKGPVLETSGTYRVSSSASLDIHINLS